MFQDLHNQNNIIAEVHAYCYHEYEGYWFVSIYIYKGLLLAFGTFLAWETRHVTVPGIFFYRARSDSTILLSLTSFDMMKGESGRK